MKGKSKEKIFSINSTPRLCTAKQFINFGKTIRKTGSFFVVVEYAIVLIIGKCRKVLGNGENAVESGQQHNLAYNLTRNEVENWNYRRNNLEKLNISRSRTIPELLFF